MAVFHAEFPEAGASQGDEHEKKENDRRQGFLHVKTSKKHSTETIAKAG